MARYELESTEGGEYEGAYSRGGDGVAWTVLGWQVERVAVELCPDCDFHAIERAHGGGKIIDDGAPDCDHSGAYFDEEGDTERTGALVVRMIGDDAQHLAEPDELQPLDDGAYCGCCGQVGCMWG